MICCLINEEAHHKLESFAVRLRLASLPRRRTYGFVTRFSAMNISSVRAATSIHGNGPVTDRIQFFFFLMGLLPWHCRLHFRLSHFAYPCLLQLVISSVWCNKLMFSGFSLQHSLVGEKRVNQPLRRLRARLTCAAFRGGTAIDTYF